MCVDWLCVERMFRSAFVDRKNVDCSWERREIYFFMYTNIFCSQHIHIVRITSERARARPLRPACLGRIATFLGEPLNDRCDIGFHLLVIIAGKFNDDGWVIGIFRFVQNNLHDFRLDVLL